MHNLSQDEELTKLCNIFIGYCNSRRFACAIVVGDKATRNQLSMTNLADGKELHAFLADVIEVADAETRLDETGPIPPRAERH